MFKIWKLLNPIQSSESVSGDEVGQCEGNNRENEVGVLCEGEVSGASGNVRNMTRVRDDECFGDNAHAAV